MSGGYQYNLTTQSQFQQMKQKYENLQQQNIQLKKTLQQMIKMNNQLTETIEIVNNSQWAKSITSNTATHHNSHMAANHDECQRLIQNLEEQVQYFKQAAQQKLDAEDHSQVVSTLEQLIQSFKQTQKYYQDQITMCCQQIDNMKVQWENKIFKIQQNYFEKTRVLEELIKEVRKKQQIIHLIERKGADQIKQSLKIIKKNSQIDTSSERKLRIQQPNNLMKQKMQFHNRQLQDLKIKQRKLNEQLRQKDHVISVYTELLAKLRKKLTQKY